MLRYRQKIANIDTFEYISQNLNSISLTVKNPTDEINLYTMLAVAETPNKYWIERPIIFLYHYGSFNYDLNTKKSDLDLIAVTMPTFEDLMYEKNPFTCREIVYGKGIIKEIDFRYFIREVIKGSNANIMEFCFSKYLYINPVFVLTTYWTNWSFLEKLYCHNAEGLIAAYKGMAESHRQKFYSNSDPKQIVNAIRCLDAATALMNRGYTQSYLTEGYLRSKLVEAKSESEKFLVYEKEFIEYFEQTKEHLQKITVEKAIEDQDLVNLFQKDMEKIFFNFLKNR